MGRERQVPSLEGPVMYQEQVPPSPLPTIWLDVGLT